MAAPVGLVMWPPWRRADELHCSFCKKSQRDVAKLIAGPDVFICSECVDICSAIVANDTCTIGDPRSGASESLETPVQCRLCAMVFPASMMLAVRDRGSICRPCAEVIAEAWEG